MTLHHNPDCTLNGDAPIVAAAQRAAVGGLPYPRADGSRRR